MPSWRSHFASEGAVTTALWGTLTVKLILAVVALFLYVRLASWIGQKLHEADVQQQALVARAAEERAERVKRQRALLALADAIDAAPEEERLRMMREAESLGFIDSDDTSRWVA